MTTVARALFVLAFLLGLLPTNHAVFPTTRGGQGLLNTKCNIKPTDDTFSKYMDDAWVQLNEFHFSMANYSTNPLYTDLGMNYKPWRWYRTRTQHGRTLLMLSFHYDVLSMTILTIGVEANNIQLIDSPFGCFGNLTGEKRVVLIRQLILDDFRSIKKTMTELESETHLQNIVYVCNEVVKKTGQYAEFGNRCCHQNINGDTVCTDQVEDAWITVLYVCIGLVKILVFFFSPLLLPSYMYSASYVASEYVVKLKDELKMKMFITESTETSIRYKKRLTIEDISEWKKFRESIEECPMDEIVPIKIPELRVKVKGKRIIPENEPPTGLLRTIYDNLIRCKIKALDPFRECCDRSVYASLETQIAHKCTWHMFVQMAVKILLLFLVPIPYYVRVYIYYQFEEGEMVRRDMVAREFNLQMGFNFYRGNIIQYLTPTHGIFIATYVFYFSVGFIIGFSDEITREKLKSIARGSLQDMLNVQRTSVLQVILRIGLWPFRKCGLLAIILCPIYASITAPFCLTVFVLYCIPTVYLSYRLLYHSRKKISYRDDSKKSIKPLTKTKKRVKKIQKQLSKIDITVHRRNSAFTEDDHVFPCTWGSGRLMMIRRVFVQIIVGLFCLSCLYAIVLLFVEAVGLVVEVLAFTMMGIIVNAGSTLRYVSMALLVIVYMHDCYNNVYESYLTFNKTVIEDVMDRVEDLKKVASLPSSMQENAAFQVQPPETLDEITTVLSFEKKEPAWRIGHLLLFLDSYDTPRIPLRLFKKLCEVRIHGAPGPVYINLLRATGKFLIIVVFLFFVMIVVMAFGNVHQISSTNQTLATLAGGFVPMLLKNVLPRKSVKLNLKTLSFKGQIDEIISEFKQNWPLYDLIFENDVPSEADGSEMRSETNSIDEGNPMNAKKASQSLETILEDKAETENGGTNKEKNDKPKENNIDTYIKEKKAPDNGNKPFDLVNYFDKPPSNGIPLGPQTGKFLPRYSVVEDNYVDLFIDMSVAETTTPWQRSLESIPSVSMLPEGETDDLQNNIPEITINSYY
ncbi:uncharacterized protein LOC110452456 [Mizuhopecten yessoensis]|uniref:Uncharacterized protein n=1 Tax=Mizuhopecten yessoensis TaxID=6573 RepID=A0A210QJN0_MIZYE|nr:uncharacterized protein LOC110452456 [Mizuhopecten yessoensis]XP_021356685.1 uncharacterized protein LOC110452456 [Mizuhopecten yessoensis]XP_021356686.1 uncharacterized protein LOC110452456 [Mizuhopecten yessoensis]XP_021356687.1 uncharacterized protein LOC110452456 [Mizuhopecten yessoensis]XP_021356688.1 uncharacterized protein LOC110452456 [Mizuhopecten yessoensis]OWF48967.1 hypothetical protein KP79_PYT12424 [Mizuhopecten yessoensis]